MASTETIECPVCGANLHPGRYSLCPACGSPLRSQPSGTGLREQVPKPELEDLALGLNETLLETGTEISDRAFNLGCGLSFFLLVAWILGVYFLTDRNWLLVVISLLVFSLALLWIVILITDVSRNRAMQRVYQDEISPVIEDYCRRHGSEPVEISTAARVALPERAPLLKFLPPPPQVEEPEIEEG